MLCQIGDRAGCAVPRNVAFVRVQPHLDLADAACDQQFLAGTQHAYGDVRLPAQKILHAVGEHQFHREIGVLIAQAGDDGRQDFHTDDIAGSDPNGTADSRALARRGALQCGSRALHRFGINAQR